MNYDPLTRLPKHSFSFGTAATNGNPYFIQQRVLTTDATVTTLQSIPLSASTTTKIEAHVVARRTGGAAGTAEDGAGYIVVGTYKMVAGVATLIGAVSALYTAEDQAAWDATLAVSGGNVLVRVTGAVNNNVSWRTTTRVDRVSS